MDFIKVAHIRLHCIQLRSGLFIRIICIMQGESDPYSVAKSMGIFQVLESPKDITTTSVSQRIIANHDAYLVSPKSLSV